MNSAQAIAIGKLAERQQAGTDVETRTLDSDSRFEERSIEVKFQDRFSYDRYVLDPDGVITDESLGNRL